MYKPPFVCGILVSKGGAVMPAAFNWDLAMALFAVIISVSSSLAVALISKKNQESLYFSKFYREHRARIIEEYIASVERRIAEISSRHPEADFSYQSAHYTELRFYVDPSIWGKIDSLEADLRDPRPWCQKKLLELAEALASDPPRSKYKKAYKHVK